MKRKIWIGIGLVATATGAGSMPPAAPAVAAGVAGLSAGGTQGAVGGQPWSPGAAWTTVAGSAGGEGGEGGEAGQTGEPSPVDMFRDIELIRGHLLVGDELIALGRWEDALPHFHHPTEEIYGGIEPHLERYSIAPFEVGLKALLQAVKAKSKEAYQAALATATAQLEEADGKMRSKAASFETFALRTVVAMLRTVAEEYSEAIDEADPSRIKNVVEYQDARGFVWQAEKLFEAAAPKLSASHDKLVGELRAQLAELKTAWPAPVPPEKAVMDAGKALGIIAKFELKAGKLLQ